MLDPFAFSAEQVCHLSGLSLRQLRYWDDTGFFSPRFLDEGRRPFGRIYSFRDVVGLRVIALLRNHHKVPLQELRRAGAWLKEQFEEPWSTLRFFVAGRRVLFDDPKTQLRMIVRSGQLVLPIELEAIARDLRSSIVRLRERDEGQIGKIGRNRYVVHNAPTIAGTRIPTSAVWNFHAAGYGVPAIIREYPSLTPDDVHAAVTYEKEKRIRKAG